MSGGTTGASVDGRESRGRDSQLHRHLRTHEVRRIAAAIDDARLRRRAPPKYPGSWKSDSSVSRRERTADIPLVGTLTVMRSCATDSRSTRILVSEG